MIDASTDISAGDWNAFLEAHPDATHCHLWKWRSVFTDVLGHDCEYLVARRDGAISGVLPLVKFKSRLFGRSVISLPFVNNGGLLANDEESATMLLDEARRVAIDFDARHVELRHRRALAPTLPNRQHKVGMLMPLCDPTALWEGLDRKARNLVRKGQKSQLEVQHGGVELVNEFYSVFADNMRDLGTPVYPKRMFTAVANAFPDSTVVFVARHEGLPVAVSFACIYRGTFEVVWASSLKTHRHLNANMLIYWQMMEYAAARGCRTFDFGRSTPGAGTFHFKVQWGAVPQPLNWEYVLLKSSNIPDQGPTNPRFHAAINAWKKLPLWVTTAIGPAIVRHIP